MNVRARKYGKISQYSSISLTLINIKVSILTYAFWKPTLGPDSVFYQLP
jgi:hypothetical protein